jgi:hypothetical protein
LIAAAIAVAVTVPIVLLVPRARQSLLFDRVLWIGTWSIAFLGIWFVLGNLKIPSLDLLIVGEVSVVPAVIGAVVAALILNGLLWGMDRFERPQTEEREGTNEPDAPSAIAAVSESVDPATKPAGSEPVE